MQNPLKVLQLSRELIDSVNSSMKIPLKQKNELWKFIIKYTQHFNNAYNSGNYNNEAYKNLNELQKIIYKIDDVNNI